jgi:excisionase family DNA binding protein
METNYELLTIDEARTILRVGRNTMYSLVQQGLPSIRVGKQIRIPRNAMLNWVDKMALANAN